MRFVRNRSRFGMASESIPVFLMPSNMAYRLPPSMPSLNPTIWIQEALAMKILQRCGDQEFLWLLLALIAMAVWVTNAWASSLLSVE